MTLTCDTSIAVGNFCSDLCWKLQFQGCQLPVYSICPYLDNKNLDNSQDLAITWERSINAGKFGESHQFVYIFMALSLFSLYWNRYLLQWTCPYSSANWCSRGLSRSWTLSFWTLHSHTLPLADLTAPPLSDLSPPPRHRKRWVWCLWLDQRTTLLLYGRERERERIHVRSYFCQHQKEPKACIMDIP